MSTPAGGYGPPPPLPPHIPPPPSRPPRTGSSRWEWWVGAIAVPVIGIVVTLVVGNGQDRSDPPAAAPAPAASTPAPGTRTPDTPDPAGEEPDPEESTSPVGLPTGSPTASPSASDGVDVTPPAGRGTARTGMWGIAPQPCTQHEQQLVDLDDGTSRVEQENDGAVKDPAGAELLYWPDSCSGLSDYLLRALPNTRVGILREDMPKNADTCAAASATGLGALSLSDGNDATERGFVEGAAICSVTDRGAVSMALIDHIARGSTLDMSVTGRLYVWPKAP